MSLKSEDQRPLHFMLGIVYKRFNANWKTTMMPYTTYIFESDHQRVDFFILKKWLIINYRKWYVLQSWLWKQIITTIQIAINGQIWQDLSICTFSMMFTFNIIISFFDCNLIKLLKFKLIIVIIIEMLEPDTVNSL